MRRPRRAASRSTQARSVPLRRLRQHAHAACTSRLRSSRGPAFVMCPRCRRSAELSSRGTKPERRADLPAPGEPRARHRRTRETSAPRRARRPAPSATARTTGSAGGVLLQPRIDRRDLARQRRRPSAAAAPASRPAPAAAPAARAAPAPCSALPAGEPIALLPQQRAQQRNRPACASAPTAADCAAPGAAPAAPRDADASRRYQPRRFASANAATSRRSVFTLRRTLAIHRREIRIGHDHRRAPPPPAPAPPTHSPSPSRAGFASAPSPANTADQSLARSSRRAARAAPRPSASMIRIWLYRMCRSMAPYTMAGCSFLSALFPQGDTPVCGAQATTRGSSQPLHLISVCERLRLALIAEHAREPDELDELLRLPRQVVERRTRPDHLTPAELVRSGNALTSRDFDGPSKRTS